jgi:hypothetical protein
MASRTNREILLGLLRTTGDLQDVFAPPNGKVCFLSVAAYTGAKMCLEHLPDERQTNLPVARGGHLRCVRPRTRANGVLAPAACKSCCLK